MLARDNDTKPPRWKLTRIDDAPIGDTVVMLDARQRQHRIMPQGIDAPPLR